MNKQFTLLVVSRANEAITAAVENLKSTRDQLNVEYVEFGHVNDEEEALLFDILTRNGFSGKRSRNRLEFLTPKCLGEEGGQWQTKTIVFPFGTVPKSGKFLEFPTVGFCAGTTSNLPHIKQTLHHNDWLLKKSESWGDCYSKMIEGRYGNRVPCSIQIHEILADYLAA